MNAKQTPEPWRTFFKGIIGMRRRYNNTWSHHRSHLSKFKCDAKSDNYFVKLKLHNDPASENSDPYEFKMALFLNVNPKYFLLFVSNFNMTIEDSWTLEPSAKDE